MSFAPRLAISAVVFAALALLACGGQPDTQGGSSPASAPTPADSGRSARTLPIPGAETTPPNPHPGGGAAGGRVAWHAPQGWVEEPPSSSMRVAQYRVPGEAGDGECVVYYFGPGQGGDAASNAARWARQFEQPDGTDSTERMRMTTLEGARLPVYLVEVTGTYDGGMTMTDAPAEKQPGAMLLGGIAQGPDAPWFFKFTGPEATVRAQRAAFESMMMSVGAGQP